jgi:serine/threonine-protein kinase
VELYARANSDAPRTPPQRLGRYEILGRLAAGGMAEVLLGWMRGPLGFERPVAIKRILPHLVENRAFVDMFIDEARIAAGIRHARVAQVHELVELDGEYFLVMEYIEGESLGGLMRRLWLSGASIDRKLAAHIIAEACAGLHAVHEPTDLAGSGRQVIHRDVSPQNLMITYAGEVKILDFGIAKAADTARTQGGQVKGKCEYMSPEQCCGEPMDRRSDIFSLGVLLYELTVGRRLFKRASEMQVFHAICHEPIPRPTEIDPAYPDLLAAICDRALARAPRDRYATMLDMRRDLVAAIRQIGGEQRDEEETLAAIMTRLFADRIRDKRDMLLGVQSGSPLVTIPVAEADLRVELPEVRRPPDGEPSRVSATASSALRARMRRSRGVLLLTAAVVAIVGLWIGGKLATRDIPADAEPGSGMPAVPAPSGTKLPGSVGVTAPAPAAARSASPGSAASANGFCGVRDHDGKLFCANTPNAALYSRPSLGSPITNHLRTSMSWFTCWVKGDRYRGGAVWYYTVGDDSSTWGWVPGTELMTPPGFDADPSEQGLRYCPSVPAPPK